MRIMGLDYGSKTVGVAISDALGIQVSLGLGNGGSGVDLGVGVQKAHGLDFGLGGKHHVQNEGGIQRVGGAGDGGKSGETGGLGI